MTSTNIQSGLKDIYWNMFIKDEVTSRLTSLIRHEFSDATEYANTSFTRIDPLTLNAVIQPSPSSDFSFLISEDMHPFS